jgi:cholesterol oxidase
MATHEHADVVVVGSGFGGAVAAQRFAEAGRQVVVLERGKAYPPGAFPRDPQGVARNFWDPSAGRHGLFNVWTFDGIEALVASGLGGGSLIYANVLLRKDEPWFVEDRDGAEWRWPLTRAALDPHYDTVERMLGATPFPFTAPGYEHPKTQAMRDAATRLGLDWHTPNLAVTFARDGEAPHPAAPLDEAPYGNLHGRPRRTCRLCGECDVGCNDGAKNTLDHTYLSSAVHHGADVRTRAEVRRFAPRPGGGYAVGYVRHDPENEGRATATGDLPLHTITCDRLVLAAGTLGTTWLLLANRSALPEISPTLGTRFCGNGDLLGFLTNARHPDGSPRALHASAAPVITSTIRVGDHLDGHEGRGFYLQDAGYPHVADWLVEMANVPATARRAARFALGRAWARLRGSTRSDISSAVADLVGDGALSATSMPLLGMGRDVPDGNMRLADGRLAIDWTIDSSAEYFARVRRTMAEVTDALGGRFVDNPTTWLRRVITVHPLGGAPMGRHPGEGVVDADGEVFGHPGLYILDGAAMPGPIGPNPALTIAAFADRSAQRALDRGRPAVTSTPLTGDAARDAAELLAVPDLTQETTMSSANRTGLRFTEVMAGHVTTTPSDDRLPDHVPLRFRLTIHVDDIDAFVDDPLREARATGTVASPLLGGQVAVEHGVFNLFVHEDEPGRRTMRYRLHVTDREGRPRTVRGHKDVADGPGFDVWADTTTLFVHLCAGHVEAEDDADAGVVAAGVLRITAAAFARQLTTFRTHGPSPADHARALARFMRLFAGELWQVYGPGSPRRRR